MNMKSMDYYRDPDIRGMDFYYKDKERPKRHKLDVDNFSTHAKFRDPLYDNGHDQVEKVAPSGPGRSMSFSIPAHMNLKVDWPYLTGSGMHDDGIYHSSRYRDSSNNKRRDKIIDGLPADRHGYHRRHSYAGHSPNASTAGHAQYPIDMASTQSTGSNSSNKENAVPVKKNSNFTKNKDAIVVVTPSSSNNTSISAGNFKRDIPGVSGRSSPWVSQMQSLLDAHTSPIIWDIRQPLSTMTVQHAALMYFTPDILSMPLTSTASTTIRFICKDFPWTFDLTHNPGSRLDSPRPITATDALQSLHTVLHKPLEDAVWGAADEPKRESIERAMRRRDGREVLKVDWLGRQFMFKGFLRDEIFAKKRLHPGVKDVSETWVAVFSKA